MIIEKIPPLTCQKCGGIRVVMTIDGPECADCDKKPELPFVEISDKVEYLIYQNERLGG